MDNETQTSDVRTEPRKVVRSTPRRTADDAQTAGVGALAGDHEAPGEGPRESMGDAAPERLTRVSRFDLTQERFAIPQNRKKPGWDYEWKAISVLGQPVDGSEQSTWYQQGWRPVAAKDWPELCPPGYKGDTVTQFGQMLMQRPMSLTMEAKQEDYTAAKQQEMDRMRAAADGRPSGSGVADVKGVVVKPLGLEIQGEAGTYSKK